MKALLVKLIFHATFYSGRDYEDHRKVVILMYDKTSRCTDIDKARRKMFAKRLTAEQIRPTFDALEQHLRRAIYQGMDVMESAFESRLAS